MIISKTIFRFTSNKFCKDLALMALFLIALILTISLAKSIKAQIVDFNNNQDVGGVTSLMSAVNNNDEEGVKFYIRGGDSIVNKKNSGGASSLHIATRNGYFNIVKILVENGANVNEEDNEGWTPIMRSALLGDYKTMEYLINNNADLSKSNNFNETVIIHSSASDCNKCLEIIFANKSLQDKMNYMFLKDQLEESYEISRVHENKQAQNLIVAYQNEIANIKQVKESNLENTLEPKNEGQLSSDSSVDDNKNQPKGDIGNALGAKKSRFKLKNLDQAQELNNQNLQESSLNQVGNKKENKKSKFIVKDLQKDKPIDKQDESKKSKYKLKSPNIISNQENKDDQKLNNNQNEVKKVKYKLINKDQEKTALEPAELNISKDNNSKNESSDKIDEKASNQNEGKKVIYNLNYKQVQINSDQNSQTNDSNNKQKNNQSPKEQKPNSDNTIKKDNPATIKEDKVNYKNEDINKNSLLKSMIIENPNYISDLMGS